VSGILGAFLVEVALVTYRSVTQGGTARPTAAPIAAPLPSTYTSVIVVYGTLGLLPDGLAPIPQLLAWGFVVATFLNLFTPGSANAAASANASLAQGLSSNALAPGAPKPTAVKGK
jgi:hypothetical protein